MEGPRGGAKAPVPAEEQALWEELGYSPRIANFRELSTEMTNLGEVVAFHLA